MQTNALPHYDASDNPTGCCPRFDPQGWDDQDLHFDDKLFVRATTRGLFHIPLNMGSVFKRTFAAIEAAGARDDGDFIVLSRDSSPWTGEHYFAVSRPLPGADMAKLSGDYLTKVFEGPFSDAPKWEAEMADFVAAHGRRLERNYYFFTTCPRCAKVYGKNYVVAVARLQDETH